MNPAASPCTRNCCLDAKDICQGCFRSMEEIVNWGRLSDKQRKIVLLEAEKRRKMAQR